MIRVANTVWFVAGSAGTDEFGDGEPIPGARNMAGAALSDGAEYSYRAVHPSDPLIWENGYGAYDEGEGALARNAVESSTGTMIDFAVPPVVHLAPLRRDFDELSVGVDVAPATINIGALDDGVLTLPARGSHFVLDWPGNADFEIEGFGNLRPPGKAFSLLIPRTAALTGGTGNELGNRVRFIHTASGPGLDLTMAMRMVSGSAVYTYDAYPNANSANAGGVSAAALYEQLTFVPLGDGRHRLVRLPDPACGSNPAGMWRRFADGSQICRVVLDVSDQAISNAYGSLFIGNRTWGFPAAFVGRPSICVGDGRWGNGRSWSGVAAPATATEIMLSFMDISSRASGTLMSISATSDGAWK